MKSAATVDTMERSAPAGGFGVAVLWTLYVLTVRQHLHGRRWMVVGALFLLPAGLAILIRATAPEAPGIVLEFLLAFLFIPHALLPLAALIYASGMIQDEQEEQTLTYLLIRPIPKWAIYTVKLAATVTMTVLLTVVFTVLTYAALKVRTDTQLAEIAPRCLTTVGVHCLSVACYCCIFGLMSILTKRTLIVGILYVVIFEGIVANLPFGVRLITVIYYARLIAYRSMGFILETRHEKIDIAAHAWKYELDANLQLVDHPSLRTCVMVMLTASLVFTLVASILCSRREFHVKTPEGN